MGIGGKIMAVRLMVVGGGGEIICGRGLSWLMAAKLWLVVGGRGWSHDLVIFRCDFVAPSRNT